MPSLDINTLIWTVLVFAVYGFSVCLHEFGHAIVAYWGGDRSVKAKGYLSLNPLRYAHPTTSLILPLIFLLMGGIPLPGAAVYINTAALKGRGWDSAVSAAGPLATFLVAVIIACVVATVPVPSELEIMNGGGLLFQGLALLLTLEVAGVCLNLLPIPGLDGYGIIEPWLPMSWQRPLRRYARYGVWFLFGALWFVPSLNRGFWSVVDSIVQTLGVSPIFSTLGFVRFRQGAQILFAVLLLCWIIYYQWQKRHPKPAGTNAAPTPEELTAQLADLDQQLAMEADAATLSNKAWVLTQLDRDQEALVCLRQSLDLRPEEHRTWLLKGYVAHRLQQLPVAIEAYQQVLKLDAKGVAPWQTLGEIYAELDQYEKALAAYHQASQYAESEGELAQILHLKSHAYFYLQRYEDCVGVLNIVLSVRPQDANAHYNQACCYAQLGQVDCGVETLATALEYGSESLREQAQSDEDLMGLRSHPRYSTAVSSKQVTD